MKQAKLSKTKTVQVGGATLLCLSTLSLIFAITSPASAQCTGTDQRAGYEDPNDIDGDGMCDYIPNYSPPQFSPSIPTYQNNNQTGWAVCNRSSENAAVAYSYYNGQAWVREGWVPVASGQCSLLTSDILTQYIYLYAQGTNGIEWRGNKPICVHPSKAFQLPPMEECSAPYQNLPFMAIDTKGERGYILFLD